MPNLGGPEILIIFVIVLLLFGAKKIPELARGLGKSMGEFKKAREEFEDEIKRAADDVDLDKKSDSPAKSEPRQS
ncbi:Sec-independent protein translocase subunit TatA/TatB [Roseibacillus persicicus]|uniref:Sec-independent protein translocase protein TatA n=1 Tax=Roseibacillus persicicus TaxID=454148 RepID=A0A918TQ34_9BACT|nr:twin-arginine translocase TatA/TatE family subunit [Roseibacillus persicicus]MDQ8191054.1 twin-arginine translocase TatA/TatE family subunit [Roseibacillus persicicus]GHC56743.1 Sec-independent protein translocase protein TatA [Roseibacillus persicicus]